jgi:hypothetical protein
MTTTERVAFLERHELPECPDDVLAVYRMAGAMINADGFVEAEDDYAIPAAVPEEVTEPTDYQLAANVSADEPGLRRQLLYNMALSVVLLMQNRRRAVVDRVRFYRYPSDHGPILLCRMTVSPPMEWDIKR